jgi:3-deoxy-D-manno-octulosonic-acid transferase
VATLRERLALAAYGTAFRLLLPAVFVRYWWRGRREPGYRQALGERLGLVAPQPPGAVWLHAVSLGETRAASALVAALRERLPGMRLLLTHGTATGREAGRALLREGDTQAWLPLDTPGAVRRFLARARPSVGVLMETEVWPQLLAGAHAAGVPMVLANARLSARSARRGERFPALMGPSARVFAEVLAQTEDDAARLRTAGARTVVVCGNLKFDVHPAPALVARGQRWRAELARPVVLAAITREGEEAMLLDAWASERRAASGPAAAALLLVVPRHPQRFDEVAGLLGALGLRVARRSAWGEAPDAAALAADAWLGDSLGEMPQYYGCADVALLGGSFAPLGGHNLIEAAACGCPLVMGPSTFNFAEAAEQAIAAGAAWRADDMARALRRALDLLGTPAQAEAGARALAFSAQHRGAADRMAARIAAIVGRAAG